MQTSSLSEDIDKALAAHDQQHAAPAAAVPPPSAALSIQMLVSMLAIRPLDEFQGLDSEYIGLLRGLFMRMSSLLDLPAAGASPGLRSGSAPAPPAPTPPAAVQPAERLTKPTTPPPRPPRSPTHPPACPIKAKKTALWSALAAFKPSDIALTLRGDFVLTFGQVLDSDDHAVLAKKLKKVYSVDVQVLNRGTTSLLKFPLVPTRHPDGSTVTNEWLHTTISSHP
ncbi:hypothetical protein AX14_010444 [Amanita brunnescens Koide BX004]|nr:hypothetical protein AX14_010444 [Amanita brunnescens Koide BX004]